MNINHLVTKSSLIEDLRRLGLLPGQTVMLHASVSAIGWIVGGPEVVLQALLDVLTPTGTLMMYASWEDDTENWQEWSVERQAVYLEERQVFDPLRSRAKRDYSILTEYLRTLPGAFRSGNPCASVVAIGQKAQWITNDHPLQYGYGTRSPFEKLVESGGRVLLLGSPLGSVTMLHFSECIANVPEKRIVHYKVPLWVDGARMWMDVEEYDTADGIVDWENEDYFELIVKRFLEGGEGIKGKVGCASSYLLDAQKLHKLALGWMEANLR